MYKRRERQRRVHTMSKQCGDGSAGSAVQDMTVAEVRKALQKIRQLWFQSVPNNPLFISSTLFVKDKTIAEFCTEFVYGHHLKRHYKSSHTHHHNRQRENQRQKHITKDIGLKRICTRKREEDEKEEVNENKAGGHQAKNEENIDDDDDNDDDDKAERVCSGGILKAGAGSDVVRIPSKVVSTGIAGPKGEDPSDPFPFTPGWKPKYYTLPTESSAWWNGNKPKVVEASPLHVPKAITATVDFSDGCAIVPGHVTLSPKNNTEDATWAVANTKQFFPETSTSIPLKKKRAYNKRPKEKKHEKNETNALKRKAAPIKRQ